MATSASVSDTPPVEFDDDVVATALTVVVVVPTLIVVVPEVVVGPVIVGPVVVVLAEVDGDPRAVALEGLGLGRMAVQLPVVVGAPKLAQAVKVPVPSAVVELVAVVAGEMEVVLVVEFVVENAPCVVLSAVVTPSVCVTTRLYGVATAVVVYAVTVDKVVVVLTLVVVDTDSESCLCCCCTTRPCPTGQLLAAVSATA
jgi:hypothetical protein